MSDEADPPAPRPSIARLADAVSRIVNEAIQECTQEFREGGLRHEPAFSERLATRIQDRINKLDLPAWSLEAQKVTASAETDKVSDGDHIKASIHSTASQGPGSEEKKVGADLVAVFDVKAEGDQFKKGVLVQAKRLEPNRPLGSTRLGALITQCNSMIKLSGQSYVFIYSKSGVQAVAADDIVANPIARLDKHPVLSPMQIFQEIVLCTKGDPVIDDATADGMRKLLAKHGIPVGLAIRARRKSDERLLRGIPLKAPISLKVIGKPRRLPKKAKPKE